MTANRPTTSSPKSRARRAVILREYFHNAILLAALKETVRSTAAAAPEHRNALS